ncbi:MAG: molybdopterin-synthase adenylyltransferase MoeB [Bacillota bacterium]|nr:molybdopterin-synthase adenylyltransferase MoeB [Bacillota bacterium]
MEPAWSETRRERYGRQLVLTEIGPSGQHRLWEARVLIIGAGGLGSPAALYLAAAGVGRIGLVDNDTVELSNLQRQILYRTGDVGRVKVALAESRLAELNPDVRVTPYAVRLDAGNVGGLIDGYDLVIDAVDNFATRYLVNEACVSAGKPLVEAGVLGFEGMLTVIKPGEGPCYRCIFPDPPPAETVPDTRQAGVLGTVAGTLGILQATEALKLILEIGDPLVGRMLHYDGLSACFREILLERLPSCPVCGRITWSKASGGSSTS